MSESRGHELHLAAEQLTNAASGPLGPRPVQAIIREHLDFFVQARAMGASWLQIAALLRKLGLTTRRGSPISADVLRATFVRCRSVSKKTKSSTSGAATGRQTDRIVSDPPGHAPIRSDTESIADRILRVSQLRAAVKKTDDR